MASSVTLRDVAKAAGVSLGTASQALNNRPHVAPETRARVLDAARSLGYPIKDAPPSADGLKVIGLLTTSPLHVNTPLLNETPDWLYAPSLMETSTT